VKGTIQFYRLVSTQVAAVALLLGMTAFLAARNSQEERVYNLGNATGHTQSPSIGPSATVTTSTNTTHPSLKPAAADVSKLDSSRQYALGMIESGNDDRAVGRAGELSRYQIMPAVWNQYSGSRRHQDVNVSTDVAQRHWAWLHQYFKTKTGRPPTEFDMYVLWNTRLVYYSEKGFDPARLQAVVRDRAQRFANLAEHARLRH
jgi:hypothetical protein